jgi:hypothetical protein
MIDRRATRRRPALRWSKISMLDHYGQVMTDEKIAAQVSDCSVLANTAHRDFEKQFERGRPSFTGNG